MSWTTACTDWQERIKAGQYPAAAPVLFPEVAEHYLSIFKQLRIVDMLGRPEIGDVTRDWVYDFVRSFFGSLDDVENRRHIQEFMLLIAKKNTKSTIAAGVMLTVLICNVRHSAEFLIIAPTVEAANNAFKPARDMIRADPRLAEQLHIQEHIRTITLRQTGAQLKVLAADANTVSGSKAAGILIDELWLFGKQARAGAMLTEATGGLMARPEGFIMYLTTQSDESPAGIFREKLHYMRGVRDGRIVDPQCLPVLYEYPPDLLADKSYMDPDYFYITNPNLGASVDKDYLNRKIQSAQEGGEESIQQVLAKHLNVEIGLALSNDYWPGAEFWDDCAANINLASILSRCDVVVAGIDAGGLDDLLALTIAGREKKTEKWLFWSKAWAFERVLVRRKQIAPKLQDLQKLGQLSIVPEHSGEDVAEMIAIIHEVDKKGLLHRIGVDPQNIKPILKALEDAGIEESRIIGISQGWQLTGAIKTAERQLAARNIQHDGSELMQWCVGNAKIEPRANSVLITKKASGFAKIDPLMSFLNAVELLAANPPAMTDRYRLMVF